MNQLPKNLVLIICLSFTSFSAIAEQLDSLEKQIVEQVNLNLKQAIQTLEIAVNINSDSMNFNGVKRVGKLFQSQLDQLGLSTQWIEGKGFGRAGHLLASHTATKQQGKPVKILMIGHLDTVFAQSDSFQKFERRDQRYVAGPGITDMKGGDVIIIETIRVLKALNLLDNVSIKVVMTGDEEKSGRPLSLSKQAIIEAAQWADIALGFEDGDGDINTAVIARRGSVGWTLDVSGKAAHSSQIFREDIGFGAAYESARILNQFREQLTKEELLTVNPGLLVAGTRVNYHPKSSAADTFGKSNVIAKTATITGDIRALSPQQLARVKKTMQAITANNLAHTSAKITFDEGYPPMAPTEGNQQLLRQYSQVSQDLGYGKISAVDPRRAGAADISFAADHVVMALDGLGLMGVGGHTKDEVADMQSFAQNIHKAAILIARLSRL